jgi:hypothetical protein
MTIPGRTHVLVDREPPRETAAAPPLPEDVFGACLGADQLAVFGAELDERAGSEAEPLADRLWDRDCPFSETALFMHRQ